MKKVILRFLRNKAIEIGEFLLTVVFSVVVIAVIAAVFASICYGIGYTVLNIGFLSQFIVRDVSGLGDTAELGIASLFLVVITAMVIFIVVGGIISFVGWFVAWLKENWQRAKREIEEEAK